jgi:hypothetical protein
MTLPSGGNGGTARPSEAADVANGEPEAVGTAAVEPEPGAAGTAATGTTSKV